VLSSLSLATREKETTTMPRIEDIDPQDIDPDTGRPYAGYSSPAIDTSVHDHEMDVDDDPDDDDAAMLSVDAVTEHLREGAWEGEPADPDDGCSNPGGHKWAYTGTQYGGDDERWQGEGRCYCQHCGADGDA
jgi:hypothetical protein